MTQDINLQTVGHSMLSSTKERIAQIIRLIITTTCAVPEEGIYGEKYGVPEYGCSAALHLWDFLATADIATLTNSIYTALKNVPDIQVFYNDIDVDVDEVEQSASITIYYKNTTTNEKDKVVITQ